MKVKMTRYRFPFHSIRFRIAFFLMLFLLILSLGVFVNNLIIIRQEQSLITEYNDRILKLYISQTDLNLSSLDNYITNVLASNENLPMFNGETARISESDQVIAARRFRNEITGMLQQFYWLHSFYISGSEQTRSFILFHGTLTYDFQRKVEKTIETMNGSEGWHAVEIGGSYYYLRPYRSGKILLCALVSMDNMMSQMELLDSGFSSQFLLVNHEGKIVYGEKPDDQVRIELDSAGTLPYTTGRNHEYTVIAEHSSVADLNAVVVCRHELLQRNLYVFRMVMMLAIIYILLAGIAMFVMMHRMVFRPLRELQKLSNEVLRGNFDYRLSVDSPFEEFSDTNRSVNKMLDNIEHLRMSVYEEQLRSQQMEIVKLQQEIKPHFLLNSFNLIYNMALEKDFAMIQEMCLCLSRYFRYRVHSGTNLVPLSDEIECVQSYLSIQRFRFPEDFDFSITVEPEAERAQVIPLMIQTFAENAIIHALKSSGHMTLTIQAGIIQYGGSKALSIEISDTGAGYPENILKAFKSGTEAEENGMGIGIPNIQRRLKLMFNTQARMLLSNDPVTGGAHTTIITPLIVLGESEGNGG